LMYYPHCYQLYTPPVLLCPVPFSFNDTPPTEIYTLSLHDALPIWTSDARTPGAGKHNIEIVRKCSRRRIRPVSKMFLTVATESRDRKSTRLNSSHGSISYAVFCLKKKNK